MESREMGLTPVEINRVFELLGLGTQQERDQFLAPTPLVPSLPPTLGDFFVTHLSNNSEAQNPEDYQVAELG